MVDLALLASVPIPPGSHFEADNGELVLVEPIVGLRVSTTAKSPDRALLLTISRQLGLNLFTKKHPDKLTKLLHAQVAATSAGLPLAAEWTELENQLKLLNPALGEL